MSALQSLRRAVSALAGSPVLFLGGFLFALVSLPGNALSLFQQAGVSVPGGQFLGLPIGLVVFLITPFLVAGLVGMVDESLAGSTGLGTLLDVGRDSYLTMLLAFLARLAIMIVVGIVVGIVGVILLLVVGFGAIASLGAAGGGGGAGAAVGGVTLLVVGGYALLAILLFVLLGLLLEFLPAAVVLDGDGPIDAIRSSASVVASNKVNALGYILVRIAVSLLVTVPTTAFVLIRTVQRFQSFDPGSVQGGAQPAQFTLFSVPEAAALLLIGFALTMLLTPFRLAYMTTFYDDHRADGLGSAPGTPTELGVES
jgi:hypothetical protein